MTYDKSSARKYATAIGNEQFNASFDLLTAVLIVASLFEIAYEDIALRLHKAYV
jgi:hypothetical protein